jgi:hypothetical protein
MAIAANAIAPVTSSTLGDSPRRASRMMNSRAMTHARNPAVATVPVPVLVANRLKTIHGMNPANTSSSDT